jgi:4-hydroxy-3-methylbut-2-enyl diphosphate reductase
MKIIRAESMGFCFGVRDALQLALQQARHGPLTILGELVHNPDVLSLLRTQGIQIESNLAQIDTPVVMVTAHGAARRSLAQVRQAGFQVLEATCPLVHLVHRTVKQLVAQGYHPIVIGKRDHTEVRGITGDLDDCDVILDEAEVAHLRLRDRIGIVAQTTQPIDLVRRLVQLIRQRFPSAEVRFIDTVCQPTKQRQAAATELARQVELVVVIGGKASNNTRQLLASCRAHCPRVYHIEHAEELDPHWFAGIQSVGFTAGTSTPDFVIDEVEHRLHAMAAAAEHPAESVAGWAAAR